MIRTATGHICVVFHLETLRRRDLKQEKKHATEKARNEAAQSKIIQTLKQFDNNITFNNALLLMCYTQHGSDGETQKDWRHK